MITEIKNVREKNTNEYICTITIKGEDMEFYAIPNGGGYCDEVIRRINAGEFKGNKALYVPPVKPNSAKRQEALSAKWLDPFALLDDILERGIPAVKTERDAIKGANPK